MYCTGVRALATICNFQTASLQRCAVDNFVAARALEP